MAQDDASIEDQLELKKRARRRLVGAAALALFAAVVLPMVMDHEPRPPAQDIQVRIPSQDGGDGLARILPSAKPAATPLPPVAPVAESKPAPEARAEPQPETKPETKPEAPAPKPAETAAAPAEKKTEPVPAKASDKPPARPVERKGDAAPAAAAAPSAEQWVVQLGAYKEAGNVKLLLTKLKEMGVPAYTEKFDSPQGPRTRVRAGPFASKDAAEKARAKAKIIGVDGPVAPK